MIVGLRGIRDAIETGRFRRVQAKAHTEQIKGNRTQIVVTEILYQVNKSYLCRRSPSWSRTASCTDISDLRDESDRNGCASSSSSKREAVPKVVLNNLYKHTQMQQSFGVNLVALVDGVPRTLSYRQVLGHYVAHQFEVVTAGRATSSGGPRRGAHPRRTAHRARQPGRGGGDHPQEPQRGDGAQEPDEDLRSPSARRRPSWTSGCSGSRRWSAEGRAGAQGPRREDRVSRGRAGRRVQGLRDHQGGAPRGKAAYADDRQDPITAEEGVDFEIEDLIAEEEMVISISNGGYLKSVPVNTFRKQGRGGVGVAGMELKEGDYIDHLFITTTHHYMLFFTNKGKVYRLKVHQLPRMGRTAKGRHIANMLPLAQGETSAVIQTKEFEEAEYLLFATRKGIVKKTRFLEYNTPLKNEGIIAINLAGEDELISVRYASRVTSSS